MGSWLSRWLMVVVFVKQHVLQVSIEELLEECAPLSRACHDKKRKQENLQIENFQNTPPSRLIVEKQSNCNLWSHLHVGERSRTLLVSLFTSVAFYLQPNHTSKSTWLLGQVLLYSVLCFSSRSSRVLFVPICMIFCQHLITKHILIYLKYIFSLQFQTKWINPSIKCVLWTFQSSVHWSLIVTCLPQNLGNPTQYLKATPNHFMQLHLRMHVCLRDNVWLLLWFLFTMFVYFGPRAATQVCWGFPDLSHHQPD